MIIALIDGDIVLHRAARAVEKRHYEFFLEKGHLTFHGMDLRDIKSYFKTWKFTQETGTLKQVTNTEKFDHAKHIFNMMIEKILRETKANAHMIYISPTDKSNFRYKIATINLKRR